MRRAVRVGLTLLLTALCTAYVIWKIDVSRTAEILGDTNPVLFAFAAGITLVTTWPMALRWKWLLDAKTIHDRLAWLTRAYFVSYAASQVLPTAVGGDATRIYETARRHPGNTGTIAGSVVLERAIGGAATLLLAAVGLALAVGEYDIAVYLWIEAVFVVDGSPDNTYALLKLRLHEMPFASQLVALSRNFGSFAAIRAGLTEP